MTFTELLQGIILAFAYINLVSIQDRAWQITTTSCSTEKLQDRNVDATVDTLLQAHEFVHGNTPDTTSELILAGHSKYLSWCRVYLLPKCST